MIILFAHNGTTYFCDLSKPIDISIKLGNGLGPNAFYAPRYKQEPVKTEAFTGAINQGGVVNFYNIKINPHGNGTHTECVSHIEDLDLDIGQVVDDAHLIARLLTVEPEIIDNGDKVITKKSLGTSLSDAGVPMALIIRTRPNPKGKKQYDYSGTNPPYFSPDCIREIIQMGVRHLLVDVPSLDREEDGGNLFAHKAFWNKDNKDRESMTITEMIYVENSVKDGMYLLNLQTLNLKLDVSPSRPVIYQMNVK